MNVFRLPFSVNFLFRREQNIWNGSLLFRDAKRNVAELIGQFNEPRRFRGQHFSLFWYTQAVHLYSSILCIVFHYAWAVLLFFAKHLRLRIVFIVKLQTDQWFAAWTETRKKLFRTFFFCCLRWPHLFNGFARTPLYSIVLRINIHIHRFYTQHKHGFQDGSYKWRTLNLFFFLLWRFFTELFVLLNICYFKIHPHIIAIKKNRKIFLLFVSNTS